MPNSEDYLDGLLDSINRVKSDVSESAARDRYETQERVKRRSRVAPEDDFLEMNGLTDYVPPRRKRRENLRRAVSSDDYLEDFVNEFELDISEEETEEFLADFEKALDEVKNEEDEFSESRPHSITLPDGESIDTFPEDKFDAEDEGGAPTDALMDNIASIVTEAKQKAEDDLLAGGENAAPAEGAEPAAEAPAEAAEADPGDDTAPPDLLQPEFAEDALDTEALFTEGDTSAKEVPLMDESGSDADLLSMLASGDGGDLMEIGDLLSADEGGEVIAEAQESYDEGAASAEAGTAPAGGGGGAGGDGEGGEEAEGGNIITKILGIIKGILPFGKGGDDEDEPVADPTAEELAAESADIIANFEEGEEEKKKEKKEKPKKEKKEKPKKEKKEKPKKEPKPPKEKKPKPPDNSPKVPLKVIFVFLLLAASITAFVVLFQKLIPQKIANDNAQEAYNRGEYFLCYTLIDETDLGEKELLLLDQAELMAKLELRYKGFESGMKQKKYAYALDSLILGYNIYERNKVAAENLEISPIYDEYGSKFVEQLRDQFGMTPEDAKELFEIGSRKEYTRNIHKKLDELSLKSKGE